MRKWLLLIIVIFFNLFILQLANAFSFNTIEVRSYIGQPLKARVILTEYDDESITDYRVALGTTKDFAQQKLARPAYLDRLNFKIVADQRQSPYLSITSTQPINLKKLQFLIAVAAVNSNEIQLFKVNLTLQPVPLYMNGTKKYFNTGNERNTLTYGPTTVNDNLADIASEMRPDQSITINQMMLAIVKRNPQAFYNQNVNGLQAGRVLEMPSRKVIKSITPDYADREVARQNAQWQDILKQQTTLKQNYHDKLLTAEAISTADQSTPAQQPIAVTAQQPTPQHQIEKIAQSPSSTSNGSSVKPANLITNEFLVGYGNSSFYSAVDYPEVYQKFNASTLRTIRAQDRLYSPIAKNWYVEGNVGFDYIYLGNITSDVYTDTTETKVIEQVQNRNEETSGYNANVGFGYPINFKGDFYHATAQLIPIVGIYYNAQYLAAGSFNSLLGPPLTINNEWYGVWSGLESRLRFNKIQTEANIKYYTGTYYAVGNNFAESATTTQSAKAHGLEFIFNISYAFSPRWQLLAGYDWQKFQANSGKFETADTNGNTDKAILHSKYYLIGIKSQF